MNTIRLTCVIGIVLAGLILVDTDRKVMGAQTSDGKSVFLLNCAACHQPNGHGAGLYRCSRQIPTVCRRARVPIVARVAHEGSRHAGS